LRLALRAGINRSHVGQIERGIGNPSLRGMVTLANTLGIDVADLLKRDKDDRRR
jgi:transcriptional regulator with XRE-family HTH domain